MFLQGSTVMRNSLIGIHVCVSQLSVTVTKVPEIINFKRKKCLFWFTVSEVSVHGHLLTLF
jgi:hypothetical protein